MLYIFWFLHQTTTQVQELRHLLCCISFDSYIKPQLFVNQWSGTVSCISFDSYIKPQLLLFHDSPKASCISFDSYIKPQQWSHYYCICRVVYLLIPTSNHNFFEDYSFWFGVVYLLIPTSNHNYHPIWI